MPYYPPASAAVATASVALTTNLGTLATAGMTQGTQAIVQARQAKFILWPNDTQTPDGTTILAAIGGGNWIYDSCINKSFYAAQATWFLNTSTGNDDNTGLGSGTALKTALELVRRLGTTSSGMVLLKPLGGGADDWLRLNQILTILAGVRPVQLGPGTWLANTLQGLPSNTELHGCPGTRIVASLVGQSSGQMLTGALSVFSLVRGANLGVANDVPAGSNQAILSSVAGLTAGTSRIALFNSSVNYGGQYLVTAISGNTITLDRPTWFAYPSAQSTCTPITAGSAQDVHVYGHGMTITGTGAWLMVMNGALRCSFQDIICDGSGGFPADGGGGLALIDTLALDCSLKNIVSYSVPTSTGFFVAGCERTALSRCIVHGTTGTGIVVNLSADCDIINCGANRNGANGLHIYSASTNVRYSGTYNGNAVNGVGVDGTNIAGENVDACFNTGTGYACDNATTTTTNPTLTNARLNGNLTGLTVGTVTGFRGAQIDCSNNAQFGIQIASGAVDTQITGYDASCLIPATNVSTTTGNGVNPIVVTTVGAHGLRNNTLCNIASVTGNTAANGVFVLTVLTPTTFSIPATGNGAYVGGGSVTQLNNSGVQANANAQFKSGVVRGNFGSGTAVSVGTGAYVIFDGLFGEADFSSTLNFGSVAGTGKAVLRNVVFDLETIDMICWVVLAAGATLVLESVKCIGSQTSTGAGVNNAGTCIVGHDVDFSAVQPAFAFFGAGSYLRTEHVAGMPYALESNSVALAGTNVTLTTVQYSYPKIVLTGTLSASIQLIFPNKAGTWLVDPTALVPGGNTLTFASGSGTVVPTPLTRVLWLSTTGSNAIASS